MYKYVKGQVSRISNNSRRYINRLEQTQDNQGIANAN